MDSYDLRVWVILYFHTWSSRWTIWSSHIKFLKFYVFSFEFKIFCNFHHQLMLENEFCTRQLWICMCSKACHVLVWTAQQLFSSLSEKKISLGAILALRTLPDPYLTYCSEGCKQLSVGDELRVCWVRDESMDAKRKDGAAFFFNEIRSNGWSGCCSDRREADESKFRTSLSVIQCWLPFTVTVTVSFLLQSHADAVHPVPLLHYATWFKCNRVFVGPASSHGCGRNVLTLENNQPWLMFFKLDHHRSCLRSAHGPFKWALKEFFFVFTVL